MAGVRRPPSHPCIASVELRRPGRLGEPKLDPQRTPIQQRLVSDKHEIMLVLTYQAWVADELSRQPQEGLFEVVVGFGGDVVVLEILLAVEGDGLGLYFALFDVDFVATKNDWNLFADTDKVAWQKG